MKLSKRAERRATKITAKIAEKSAAATAARDSHISDEDLLADISERFRVLDLLTRASADGTIRSLIATGAPGVGKSYAVYNALAQSNAKHTIISGAVSGVELYKLAYSHRSMGNVLVLDDADSIFHDEEALNVLKVMTDSADNRYVSWRKDSSTLREDDVPQSHEFKGSCIFVSNLDFQTYVDEGKSKLAVHFAAMQDRALYLDLRIHDRRALSLWIQHVCVAGKMFAKEGVSTAQGKLILDFVTLHRDNMRDMSLRTVKKLIQLSKSAPTDWQKMAKMLMVKI